MWLDGLKLYELVCFCLFVSLTCVFVCFAVLSPCPVAAASPRRCHTIYKGFAQCLMALGDSLTSSAHKDEDAHEIHSICRSVSGSAHRKQLRSQTANSMLSQLRFPVLSFFCLFRTLATSAVLAILTTQVSKRSAHSGRL